MALLDTIKAASLAARKARQSDIAASLSTLLGEIETFVKSGKGTLTDESVISIVKKFIKNVDETIKHLNSTAVKVRGEDPALDKAWDEKRLYESFLPQQLDEAQLTALINDIIAQIDEVGGKPSVGEVMKSLKVSHAGLYDGAVASKLLKARFA